ncbi:MAG TPA: hypothetical protein VJ183_06475 [Chloroflexia bacterium]|nr:hypothetical protein [Chloroflexia bacterium]
MEKGSDRGLVVATALVTFAAALGVSGGTNVVMLLTKSDLIKKHRPTLTFRSAIFGDGLILPFVNVLMMNSFKKWKPRLSAKTSIGPVVGGSAISLLFHIVQGKNGMVNWTMTRPWKWNLLGYYHFVYMATQFSYMLLYLTQLGGRWARGEVTGEQKRDLALIAANMAAFGILLKTDYE